MTTKAQAAIIEEDTEPFGQVRGKLAWTRKFVLLEDWSFRTLLERKDLLREETTEDSQPLEQDNNQRGWRFPLIKLALTRHLRAERKSATEELLCNGGFYNYLYAFALSQISSLNLRQMQFSRFWIINHAQIIWIQWFSNLYSLLHTEFFAVTQWEPNNRESPQETHWWCTDHPCCLKQKLALNM